MAIDDDMVIRIPWDRDEALILLDALIKVLNRQITRKEAISVVSNELCDRATQNGILVDDKFCNSNEIDL